MENRWIKKILIMSVCFAVTFGGISARGATETKEGYYTYEISNGKAVIKRVDQSVSGDITIPSFLGGYMVTQIDQFAFSKCSNLTGVRIPDEITSIGISAFQQCRNLTEINIPDGITRIESSTFSNCSSLKSIRIPNGVTVIGAQAFGGCQSLAHIILPTSITDIQTQAFAYCESLTEFELPDSVINLGNQVFEGCRSLEVIQLSDKLSEIGAGTFAQCNALMIIMIPDSVEYIGPGAFRVCDSLERVELGRGVETISAEAFEYCDNLEMIAVSSENMNYSSIDGNLFNKEKTKLVRYAMGKKEHCYTIPGSVTQIGRCAFLGCNNLINVEMPDGVIGIEERAFSNCGNLSNITFPDSLETIGKFAFSECSTLTCISVGDGMKSIEMGAFGSCDALTDVYYSGMPEQWDAIEINDWNDYLINATRHYIPSLGSPMITRLEGKTYRAIVPLHNMDRAGKLIVMLTNSSHMVGMEMMDIAAGQIQAEMVICGRDAITIKIILWEDFTTLRPLCRYKEQNL